MGGGVEPFIALEYHQPLLENSGAHASLKPRIRLGARGVLFEQMLLVGGGEGTVGRPVVLRIENGVVKTTRNTRAQVCVHGDGRKTFGEMVYFHEVNSLVGGVVEGVARDPDLAGRSAEGTGDDILVGSENSRFPGLAFVIGIPIDVTDLFVYEWVMDLSEHQYGIAVGADDVRHLAASVIVFAVRIPFADGFHLVPKGMDVFGVIQLSLMLKRTPETAVGRYRHIPKPLGDAFVEVLSRLRDGRQSADGQQQDEEMFFCRCHWMVMFQSAKIRNIVMY